MVLDYFSSRSSYVATSRDDIDLLYAFNICAAELVNCTHYCTVEINDLLLKRAMLGTSDKSTTFTEFWSWRSSFRVQVMHTAALFQRCIGHPSSIVELLIMSTNANSCNHCPKAVGVVLELGLV